MVEVAIYSDQPVLIRGAEALIAADPALTLSASCSKIGVLKDHLTNAAPDLALLDLTAEMTIAALKELQNLAPQCKLILWTSTIAVEFALQALTIGIRGILSKSLPLDAYRQCLHRVHAGSLWFEKSLTASFREARQVSLTRREGQLLTLLTRGLGNKEIAYELGITEGTVKVYLSHLFQKSGVKDRFGMALLGLKAFGIAGSIVEPMAGLRSLVKTSYMPPVKREVHLLERPLAPA